MRLHLSHCRARQGKWTVMPLMSLLNIFRHMQQPASSSCVSSDCSVVHLTV